MGLLRDSLYRVEFSPESLIRMGRLINAEPIFAANYQRAIRTSTAEATRQAQRNAPVLTGTLKRGIQGVVVSPWVGKVAVLASIPYAKRREFGFDNMTDAAGRTYRRGDPMYTNPDKRSHMHYMHRALVAVQPFVNAQFKAATMMSWREVIV